MVPGATYFFTVTCANRKHALLIENIDLLRKTFRRVKTNHPFKIDAIVVLPEHLHCIWTLPENDADYKTRWSLIKSGFSRQIAGGEKRSISQINRGERNIWQRRYWEHLIRDEHDFQRHVDYIHWNPVKHGHVSRVRDWQYSSFRKFVKRGDYPLSWTDEPKAVIRTGEFY